MTRAEQQARKAQQERMRQVERRHKEAARGQMDLPFLILTLLLTVIAFNLVGDGLRDALDPKLK